MTMYNTWGWFTNDPQYADRSAPAPAIPYGSGPTVGQPWPNWTGHAWQDLTYVEPPVITLPTPPEVVDPYKWLIDHGPLLDRFGPAVKLQFLESTIPRVVAMRTDYYGRKWLDLENQELKAGFYYLAGVTVPVFGTISTPIDGLTPQLVDTVFATPVPPTENQWLRSQLSK